MNAMKNINPCFPWAACLALACSTYGQSKNWETINDFQLVPGLSASSGDIGTDPSRSLIYSVGSATEGNRVAMVQASADQGANWTSLHTYLEPGWYWAHFRGFTSDADGVLYTAGELWNYPSRLWVVQESHDGGGTWSTTDAFRLGTTQASCGDIKVSPAGDVYTAGYSRYYWVVRKRAAGAQDFVSMDILPDIKTASDSEARAIGFHPTAGVFVVGKLSAKFLNKSSSYSIWVVRCSKDNGQTWATVDALGSEGWVEGSAEDIVIDSNSGWIYVSGHSRNATRKTSSYYWLVRRSIDGGKTWSTVDQFSYGQRPEGHGITIDPRDGRIIVCGYAQMPDNINRWLVRIGTPTSDGTLAWHISDDYQLAYNQSSQATDVTCDVLGNLYVTGKAADADGIDHWVTRKLSP